MSLTLPRRSDQACPPHFVLEDGHSWRPYRPGPVLSPDGMDELNSWWARRQHSGGEITRTYTTAGEKHSSGVL